MSNLINRVGGSSQAQFTATAIVSGAVVAGAIFSYQALRRQEKVEDLKSSIPSLGRDHHADLLTDMGIAPKGTGIKLILEQLARNRVFLKDDGLQKLRSAFVVVVGCGGVGSHCTAALARSGISHIRLIDFDQVTLSSLNRHAVAMLADVGTPKVGCLKNRLQQIAPWVNFDLRNELFHAKAADSLLGIISSMGAGCKSDPTRVFVGDISASTDDPLSRSTRRRLRLLGITSGINVVYSTEKPGPGKAQLLPLPEEEFQKGSVGDLGVLPDFRSPTTSFSNSPTTPANTSPPRAAKRCTTASSRNSKAFEEKLARATTAHEDAQGLKVPLTSADVGYIVEEVYKGRSALSGISTRLALMRWRRDPPTKKAAPRFERRRPKGK
ncbi:hypothetical protein DID88_007328 [Monilinia fructigena]|uniref:THIF-type NAD/FAD binding fold domain-containing protein n=1 Tax=Monilinia fructigena TaxID=38457 RepID=A0A395J7X8_9HELO|nr:hypothetical protein DID88_007328 [Monilinia fructigena]